VFAGIDPGAGENGVWGAGRRNAQAVRIAMFTPCMPVVDKAVQTETESPFLLQWFRKQKLNQG
jgi:hypothetical protein